MKKIHIILFFTLWVIASSCSTYYVSNKQVMEEYWVNRITDVLMATPKNGSSIGSLQYFTETRLRL